MNGHCDGYIGVGLGYRIVQKTYLVYVFVRLGFRPLNRANFAILHWFGLRFEPRFTSTEDMLKELYCADDPERYKKCLIQPVGQINQKVVIDEKPHLDQIIATLGMKEITQGALIRKLCTYSAENPTRKALFEFDKLIRSLYILRYLRNPQVARNSHRSQNRIESRHQLRSAIAQVGGKKRADRSE